MAPKSLLFKKTTPSVNLIIKGQGVLLFESTFAKAVLTLRNKDKTDGLIVTFTERQVITQKISNKDKFIDPNNLKGTINKSGAYYWFS